MEKQDHSVLPPAPMPTRYGALVRELRARANARHSGESMSPTAAVCLNAAEHIDAVEGLLKRAREYVTDALEAYEHSDGRDLLREIDAALSAAEPPTHVATCDASEGVGGSTLNPNPPTPSVRSAAE